MVGVAAAVLVWHFWRYRGGWLGILFGSVLFYLVLEGVGLGKGGRMGDLYRCCRWGSGECGCAREATWGVWS